MVILILTISRFFLLNERLSLDYEFLFDLVSLRTYLYVAKKVELS